MTNIRRMIGDEDVHIGEINEALRENYEKADELAKKSGSRADDEKAIEEFEKWTWHNSTYGKHLTLVTG